MAAADWRAEAVDLRVRMGFHTGEPRLDPPKYVGLDVHKAARIMGAGHGGQVLLSQATRELVDGRELRDLGDHRLKDFDEPVRLFQLGTPSFPPLKTLSNTNLPVPASSFVGRERELADVTSLLRNGGGRLVTLTGPGGSGKTRLAIEAATEVIGDYPDGVFWVGLASLREPALVVDTIAQTLGARTGLAEQIGDRSLLLLLDNFEQVIDAAAELSALLGACRNLHLLVTSRELLRLQGEVEYQVPPLAQAEAEELFCARSRLPRDDEIADLCRHLDDLPLAVELAAARTAVLSPAQIRDRLSQRLDLFKGGRDADPRQQTLRATIEWSYELLDEPERQLFARLSVFAGGCTFEAAEEVVGADVDTLQSLVDKSLVRMTGGRFWMLETIGELARERLEASAEAGEIGRRHADYFLALAERAEPALKGPEQPAWLQRLEDDHDNLRRSLDWFFEHGEPELAVRLAGALWLFWYMHGHVSEARRWLQRALDAGPDEPSEARSKALDGAGYLAHEQGERRGDPPARGEHLRCRGGRSDRGGSARCRPPLRSPPVRSAGGTGRGRGGGRSRPRGRRRLCARGCAEQPGRGDPVVWGGRAGDRVLRGGPGAPSADRGRVPDRPVARQPRRDGAHEARDQPGGRPVRRGCRDRNRDRRQAAYLLRPRRARLGRIPRATLGGFGRECAGVPASDARARPEDYTGGSDLLPRRHRRSHGRRGAGSAACRRRGAPGSLHLRHRWPPTPGSTERASRVRRPPATRQSGSEPGQQAGR